jgi:hypothetical protein
MKFSITPFLPSINAELPISESFPFCITKLQPSYSVTVIETTTNYYYYYYYYCCRTVTFTVTFTIILLLHPPLQVLTISDELIGAK